MRQLENKNAGGLEVENQVRKARRSIDEPRRVTGEPSNRRVCDVRVLWHSMAALQSSASRTWVGSQQGSRASLAAA